jgi:ATP-dependent exoDNAse (exonuclease V) beta subunit
MEHLTSEQKQAIECDQSVSVIASAGTGKTTVLTQRFLDIHLRRDVSLSQILAFTFTKKAAREMLSRVMTSPQMKREQVLQAPISTIHAFCHDTLRKQAALIGLKPDFDVVDSPAFAARFTQATERFISQALEESHPTFVKVCKQYGLQNLKKTIFSLADEDLILLPLEKINCVNQPEDVDVSLLTDFLKAVRSFHDSELKIRMTQGWITYDDLEILCLKLFDTHPDVTLLYQKRFRHILVDEFQDISPRQFALINHLYHPEHNQIFIVGDPKQSIYRFRKAETELFFKMQDKIVEHGGKAIMLSRTFRTPLKLQAYFNRIFPLILNQKDLVLFTPARTEKIDSQAGIFTLATMSTKIKDETMAPLAQSMAFLIAQKMVEGVLPEDIAILFYAKNSIPEFCDQFQKYAIPFVRDEKKSLLDEPLISFVYHALLCAAEQATKLDMANLLRNPILNFSETFVDHVVKSSGDTIFNEQTLDLFSQTTEQKIWYKLTDDIKKWQKLSQILSAADLAQIIAWETKKPSVEELKNLGHFCGVLEQWQKQGLFFIKQALPLLKKFIVSNAATLSHTNPGKGVLFLSIHSAKGLEFDHVFLVPGRSRSSESLIYTVREPGEFLFKKHDCEFEKSLKYQTEETVDFLECTQTHKQDESAELMRLLYVALTRTKKTLTICPQVSETLLKKLAKNPSDVSGLKSYNDWLYWLSQGVGAPDVCFIQSPKIAPTLAVASATKPESIPTFFSQESLSATKPLLSVTEMENYAQCPKRFQLRHLNRVRPLRRRGFDSVAAEKIRITARERGNLFHEILQFYDFRNESRFNTVVDQALFNQHLVDTTGNLRTECRLFIGKIQKNPKTAFALTQHRETREEVEFTLDLNDFSLTGKMDRLVLMPTSEKKPEWMILDYKTHHVVTEEEIQNLSEQFRFQMACYALAVSRQFKQANVTAHILFTAVPTLHTLTFSAQNLETFTTDLQNHYRNLKKDVITSSFSLTTDPHHCRGCAYYQDNDCGIRSTLS